MAGWPGMKTPEQPQAELSQRRASADLLVPPAGTHVAARIRASLSVLASGRGSLVAFRFFVFFKASGFSE